MELKTARLTLLIDPNKKLAFERLCAQHDLTASQVVRQMIRDYLVRYGVSYMPSGSADDAAAAGAAPAGKRQAARPAAGRAQVIPKAKAVAKKVKPLKA